MFYRPLHLALPNSFLSIVTAESLLESFGFHTQVSTVHFDRNVDWSTRVKLALDAASPFSSNISGFTFSESKIRDPLKVSSKSKWSYKTSKKHRTSARKLYGVDHTDNESHEKSLVLSETPDKSLEKTTEDPEATEATDTPNASNDSKESSKACGDFKQEAESPQQYSSSKLNGLHFIKTKIYYDLNANCPTHFNCLTEQYN